MTELVIKICAIIVCIICLICVVILGVVFTIEHSGLAGAVYVLVLIVATVLSTALLFGFALIIELLREINRNTQKQLKILKNGLQIETGESTSNITDAKITVASNEDEQIVEQKKAPSVCPHCNSDIFDKNATTCQVCGLSLFSEDE